MSSTSRRVAIVGLMLVAAVFLRLGFWQLTRRAERREANAAALAAREKPALQLGAGADWSARELGNRWVEATGTYDRAGEIVLRGQSYEGAPGVVLVTPLRLTNSDSAVLVVRGFVPSPDAVRVDVDTLIEPGTVRVHGLAAAIASGGGQPVQHAAGTTWARLDLAALRQRLPYPLLPIVIRQVPDSTVPRLPRRLEPPELSEGPHLNYAIQWFLFAGMSVAFAVLVVGRTRAGLNTGSQPTMPE